MMRAIKFVAPDAQIGLAFFSRNASDVLRRVVQHGAIFVYDGNFPATTSSSHSSISGQLVAHVPQSAICR